jgi:hypothetical protein
MKVAFINEQGKSNIETMDQVPSVGSLVMLPKNLGGQRVAVRYEVTHTLWFAHRMEGIPSDIDVLVTVSIK